MLPDTPGFIVTDTGRLARVALAIAGLGFASAALSQDAVAPAFDAWPHLRVAAGTVTVGDIRLAGARLELRPDGAFSARFERVESGPDALLPGPATLTGVLEELAATDDGFEAGGQLSAWGLESGWALHSGAQGTDLRLAAPTQPLAALKGLPGAPEWLGWLQDGRFEFEADLGWPETAAASWTAGVSVSDLAFDSPEGRFAGAGLGFRLQGQGGLDGLAESRVSARVIEGELLVDRVYRRFEGEAVELEAEAPPANGPPLLSLRLRDPGAVTLDAAVGWPVAAPGEAEIEIRTLALEFPGAYRSYLESAAAAWDLDGLEVTGRVDWRGAWRRGELESGDLDIRDLTVVDTQRGRFALTGLETRLKPGDRVFESRLSWRGLLLGRINLGGGAARLDAEPGLLALAEPLALDVMGGRLRLDALRYALPGARPAAGRDTFVAASLQGIELQPLTRALGWPEFGGTLNGELPGARLEDGVLSIDGGIAVEVFGGAVAITDLRVERLFGVLPSLAANIELRDLDLEQLTSTFSFGRIGGRVDGYVRGLRMLDWKPVAFDAWLGTPERQRGTNDISRRAVTHLASIGGGGATAALSGPLLRLFSNFSYRRLGLGCKLDDYVCEIRGLGDDGSGVLLLEGAGVPRITIRAYNRSVDWPQMVANLAAISEGESIEIGPASKP